MFMDVKCMLDIRDAELEPPEAAHSAQSRIHKSGQLRLRKRPEMLSQKLDV